MRASQMEMDKSHRRIVAGAARLMRKRGVEATSVNDVMKKAGLTHGGFYRHFESKEALVSAALKDAFDQVISVIEDSYRTLGIKKGIEEYYEQYLSEGHVKHPEIGCPIATLSMDVARSSQSIKESFTDGFNRAVEKLAQAGDGAAEEKRAATIRKMSMLAGAVMIARACDTEMSRKVLEACK